LLSLTLFAKTIVIEPEYCTRNDSLMLSDIYLDAKKDAILIDLPNTSRFQIPTIRLKAALKKHGFTSITDNTKGLITISKMCIDNQLLQPLEDLLRLEFQKVYKTIEIINLTIRPKTPLPPNFKDFTFEKWRINKSILRRQKGNFTATYLDIKGLRKTFYFYFEIDARLHGFKAKNNLPNGTILAPEAIESAVFDLDEINDIPLEEFEPNRWVLKNYIRQGTIILLRHLEPKPLVSRHDYVDALIKDGGLTITIRAQALNDGKKGDIIRIKTSDGRMLNGVVISNTKVLIKE